MLLNIEFDRRLMAEIVPSFASPSKDESSTFSANLQGREILYHERNVLPA